MNNWMQRLAGKGSAAAPGAPPSAPAAQPRGAAAPVRPPVRTVAVAEPRPATLVAPPPPRRPAVADVPVGFGGDTPPAAPSNRPPAARRFGAERPAEPDEEATPGRAVVEAAPARRRVQANDQQIEGFLAYQGEVLTSAGGSLAATERQRLVTAFLADGTLLVHRDNPISPESMEVREAIRRMGRQIRTEFLVELEVIRKIHEAAERRTRGSRARGRAGEALQQMQHEVLDLVAEAARRRASDIHIIVSRYEALIRMRSDGVMETVRQVRSDLASDLCAAAFNMADASDAAYRPMEYQGARISEVRTPLPEGIQSLRLQFNPLPNGGRFLVVRLLYASSSAEGSGDVDTLGYTPNHVEQIRRMRRKPFGMNIIAGPTGAGKSTTLHRALTTTMREKRNQISVTTIEDPPEFIIAGAAQLPVLNAATEDERSEKFRAAIAAALRSDPDIIMLGEMRDRASSALGFQAAMTGHQVWASLHANDAVSILDRLRDHQIETYKLTDPTLVTGLIGQRLIRRLCPRCKLPLTDPRARPLLEAHTLRQVDRLAHVRADALVCVANPEPPDNCGCRGGYTGREVIAETVAPDLEFMRFMRIGEKESAVAYWIEALGGITMLEHASQKMIRGLCDPRDVEDKAGELDGITEARIPAVFGALFNGG